MFKEKSFPSVLSVRIFRQILTDLQQKVNHLQINANNPKAMPVGQQIDTALLNEVRETVRLIKTETNSLLQKSVRLKFSFPTDPLFI